MIGFRSTWRRTAARVLTSLGAPVLLSAGACVHCAEPVAPPKDLAVAPAPSPNIPVPDLYSFRQTALEKAPSIAAARASLAAAEARAHAVNKLPGGMLFARDLPIRKQQASLGVQGYEARIHDAEAEAVHSVTWCYLAYLYASQQEDVLRESKFWLDELNGWLDEAQDNAALVKWNFKDRKNLVRAYVETVQGRRQETQQGMERALAALREAMAVGPEVAVRPMLKGLPKAAVNAATTKEDVVAMALARRGEVIQTSTLAEVTSLEISAQGRTFLPSLRTFAVSSDIHSQPVPIGIHGMEYRPGALAPEMPSLLVGCRKDRVEQAADYHDRAGAVAEKTRNLVALEAENAFYRWKETRNKAQQMEKAVADAKKYDTLIRKEFANAVSNNFKVVKPGEDPSTTRLEDRLMAGVTLDRLQVDANRAYFEYLLALAELERVTVGGFCVEFIPDPEREKKMNDTNGKAQ